jgi:glycine cleavage system transcriptional repressor
MTVESRHGPVLARPPLGLRSSLRSHPGWARMLGGVRHLAVSAIGRDRPGIVADISGVLLRHEVNVEDSQMTILRGHFAMMIVLAAPDDLDRDALASGLDSAATALGLEALTLRDVGDLSASGPEPSHMVTVYGVDHPGIVHAAATALAGRSVDITDLNTRLLEDDEGEPLYVLMMEVALPPGLTPGELERELAGVGADEGVEVTLRELEQDAL